MSRVPSFIIFLVLISTVYFGIHVFVYKSITRSLIQDPGWQRVLKWFFYISGGSFFLITFLNPFFKMRAFNTYTGTWLGLMAISFFIFLLQWIPVRVFSSHAKQITIGSLIMIAIIAGISLYNGVQLPRVKRLTIPIKNLPGQLSGFSLVQISDIHIEAFNNPARIHKIVDTINGLKPDLVVFTGDLIDGNVIKEKPLMEELKRISARYGVLAVSGNHEFYAGYNTFKKVTDYAGFRVLHNESVKIGNGLQVVGLEDDEGRRFHDGAPDLDKAMKGCDPALPTILLYHRPLKFHEAVEKGVDLQLSGHTHAGQIPPMDIIVWFYYKYPYGLYKEKDSYIYTSSGTDIWRTPMRLFSRNEIVYITLK